MGKEEIEAFLTFLATKKRVSLTTQNQAFSAILFLYKEVLGIDMSEWNIQALRAQERKHIPVVLIKEEVQKVLQNLNGTYKLIVTLMHPKGTSSLRSRAYGCGLRMSEVLNIRIKDLDFGFDKLHNLFKRKSYMLGLWVESVSKREDQCYLIHFCIDL